MVVGLIIKLIETAKPDISLYVGSLLIINLLLDSITNSLPGKNAVQGQK